VGFRTRDRRSAAKRFAERRYRPAERDVVVALIESATGGRLDADWARFVLSDVVAGPEAIFDLWRDGRRVLVAVCIDNCETEGNAAELSVFAARRAALTAEAFALAVDWALARCRSAGRSNLDLPLWPGSTVDVHALTAAGFERHHVMYDMTCETATGAARSTSEPLPTGFRWEPVSVALARPYYDTVSRAFAGLPGAFVPSFADFCRRVPDPEAPTWLLIGPAPDAPCAGYVRVRPRDDGVGEIASLGRHPRYRGYGLGRHLLSRGVVELSRRCTSLSLEVAAMNASGLALYESFGFRLAHRTPVYRRPVTGSLRAPARTGGP